MARILYLGDSFKHSTSAHRAAALRRLGHDTLAFNPRAFIPRHRVVSGLNVRTGFRLFSCWVGVRLRFQIARQLAVAGWPRADIAWLDGCPELPVSFYKWMQKQGMRVVNYNVDDPFGPRDRRKWDLYLAAVPFHDLTVVVRAENVAEAKVRGARQVSRVYRTYDPVAHAPVALSETDRQKWSSEVAFVGTWMPERGPFMTRLLELGVPLTIWGDLWQKAPEWSRLQSCWRGPAVYGEDYVKSIQCAKIALGMLSKGNRDLHTQRSAEVPYIGGAVLCGERTPEHEIMLKEGHEAVFWSDAEECARTANTLLASPLRREAMAFAARKRICRDNLNNDAVMQDCLQRVDLS